MLVMSREAGTSIYIGTGNGTCLVTLLRLWPDRKSVSVLVNRAEDLDSRSFEVAVDGRIWVGERVELILVDVRGDKARIGIEAPVGVSVHRFEVYEAIRREKSRGGESEDGLSGSAVPRPTPPRPPSLDVGLEEPRAGEEDGD